MICWTNEQNLIVMVGNLWYFAVKYCRLAFVHQEIVHLVFNKVVQLQYSAVMSWPNCCQCHCVDWYSVSTGKLFPLNALGALVPYEQKCFWQAPESSSGGVGVADRVRENCSRRTDQQWQKLVGRMCWVDDVVREIDFAQRNCGTEMCLAGQLDAATRKLL